MFGAGLSDSRSSLPGLPNMYWLQHNSVDWSNRSPIGPPSGENLNQMYQPFVWSVTVIR